MFIKTLKKLKFISNYFFHLFVCNYFLKSIFFRTLMHYSTIKNGKNNLQIYQVVNFQEIRRIKLIMKFTHIFEKKQSKYFQELP